MRSRALTLVLAAAIAIGGSGCSLLDATVNTFSAAVGLSDTAVVIAKTAQIRTSYAVVAADLLEVKRGDRLDVLDKVEFEKVLWYRVRARDEDETEGWIEAQNVITNEVLESSKKLAEGFKDQPAQAAGKLRAAGITSFDQLARTPAERIREIIQPQEWQKIEPELWIAEAKTMAAQKAAKAAR